ncbi:MAG TPA: ABC transporter permease [Vicinamibacterales bacterium]
MSIRRFFRRRYWDEERARELEAYLAQEIDDNIARGLPPEEARSAARRKLGNTTRIREEIYTMNSIGWLESIWQDLRYGARILARNPAFATITIASLALGIGANTAIFQLVNAVEFRTLPVRAPQELAEVRPLALSRWGNTTGRRSLATYAIWDEVRKTQHSFSGVLAWGVNRFDLSISGESRFVDGLWVSGGFFDVLGVAPQIGRVFSDADDMPGCGAPGVVISDAFWRREYAGARGAVGSTLRLNGHPFEIVGVTPPEFSGVEVGRSFDIAVPICSEPLLEPERDAVAKRHYWWLDIIGRLRPGVTIDKATADLNAISPAIFRATLAPQLPPEPAKKFLAMKLSAVPASTGVSYLRGAYQQPLRILLAVAGGVLLIVCANLASLMLARATARDREIAVRLAIGASRSRIVRQLMAESLLLAATGAVAGAIVARLLSGFLVAFMSTDSSRLFFNLGTDWRVLAFTCGLAAAACVLFGLTPAIRATRQSARSAIRTGRGMTDSRERFATRRFLVAVQVTLSVVLVVTSMLFVRTAKNLANVRPGFRTDGILIADFDVHAANVPPALQPRFERELRERIGGLPGVQRVADAAIEPLVGSIWNDRVIVGGAIRQTIANENHVSPGFFKALDIPILAGRDFTEADLPGTPWVAIVNESFAEKLLGTKQPIGRTFKLEIGPGDPDPIYEVVGVVPNTKYADVRDGFGPIAYFPEAQMPTPDPRLTDVQVLVRSSLPLSVVSPQITAAGRAMNPDTLVTYRTLRTDTEATFLRERLMATLSAFFAGLAAFLAMIGLYGVMSYMVTRRSNEIGIRLALGADGHRVLTMILREAGLLLIVGLAAGALLSTVAARATATLLFGVTPQDPLTLAVATGGLACVGVLASWLPANRASRIQPAAALRIE